MRACCYLPRGSWFPSVSRQEISLNLQPGQQVTLAGYTFRFERLDLQAKGNYTSEKAIVALFDHQQRIGELMPERRFLRSTSSANDGTVNSLERHP
ncbi:heme lyase subunit NrfE [Escherichia coli]|nr:heme lyase subunit NrfE [Escherichia coli]